MERDLELLDRCLTKLAVSGEEIIEATVASILLPVLDKLGSSQDAAVRKKATEVVLTVHGLVKDRRAFALPLDDLVAAFRSHPGSRVFSLLFLNMALERADPAAVRRLLPDLLVGISTVAAPLQQGLLRSLLPFFADLPANRDLVSDAAWKRFVQNDADRAVFLSWALKVLLLPSVTEQERLELTVQDKRPLVWPGNDGLGRCKDGFMRLLDVVEFFPKNLEVFPHFLVALGDSAVQERASTAIMRRRVDRESVEMMDAALLLLERANPPLPFGMRDAIIAQLCKSQIVSRPPLLPRTLKVALGALFAENDASNRMKTRGIQLLRWMLQHVQGEHLNPFATGLVAGILQLVAKQLCIPATEPLREGGYTVIGAVIRACPGPFRSSLAIPSAMAATLAREPQHSSVRDALRMALYEMSPSYAGGVADAVMVEFLQSLARSPSPDVRSVGGRWAKEAMPFSNAMARAVALSMSDDDHLSVSREAKQALNATVDYPPFDAMLDAVFLQSGPEAGTTPPLWHEGAIKFLWRCLPRPEALLDMPQAVLVKWDTLLWNAMEKGRVTSPLPAVACHHLVYTVCMDPLKVLHATRESWIETRWGAVAMNAYAGTIRSDGRPVYATLAALVHAALSPLDARLLKSVDTTIDKLCNICTGQVSVPADRLAAAVHLLGLLGSTHPGTAVQPRAWELVLSLLRKSQEPVIVASCLSALSELSRRADTMSRNALEIACEFLSGTLAKSERSVAEAAVHWIASIALGSNLSAEQRNTALTALFKLCPPSTHGEISWVSGEAFAIIFAGWATECAHSGNYVHWKWLDGKRTTVEIPEIVRPALLRIYREPMSSGNIKQRECVSVWICSLLRFCPWLIKPHLSHVMQALSVLLADPSALTRECASRGLLYAWNQGGEEDKSILLSGLVREFGPDSGTATSGGAGAAKIKFDREIFPDDALRVPKAPTATTVSANGKEVPNTSGDGKESFRQLAGVAKGVDASLTPSLMSLASDPTVWTGGGRAAAFSSDDSRLIRAARSQLMPFLPKIFPTLWRGQFWPEVYVSRSFRRVLRALCSVPTATPQDTAVQSEEEKPAKRTKGAELSMAELLSAHYPATCQLLIASCRDRDASTREAGLSALPDLLTGRSWDDVREFFSAFWKMVLVGMDDMREGVREAAVQALGALTSFSARVVDLNHTPIDSAVFALRTVVEELLEHGVASPAKEVQTKSVVVLKTVITAAGTLIEPHVPNLLEKLLHCASALEPEMISYLAQQQNSGISSDDLHKARAAMSRMTPLGECVDLCLKNVTTHNILLTVKSIESGLLGAGLPTLLQSAWAVTSLSRGAAIEILQGKPATTLTLSLLNVMTRQMGNVSAYRELCTAVAAIAAFASDKLWSLKILTLVTDGYFAGEEPARFFAGLLMLSLSSDNRSSEVLRRRIKDCIAVVFVGKHDSEKRVRSAFSEVFVGIGAPSAVALYNQEILDVIINAAESPQWQVRRQCYRALAVLASSLSAGRERAISLCIKEAQSPKHWKGKGSLLQALATLVSVLVASGAASGLLDETIVTCAAALCDEMVKKGPTRSAKYKGTAAKALCSVVRETVTVLHPESRQRLWKGLWPSPLRSLLMGHVNDKAYIALHDVAFAIVSYGVVSDVEGVLETISHGIKGQSAWEVRVSALNALASLVAIKSSWSDAELAELSELLLFCLSDKFVAVRERCASLICSDAFAKLPAALRQHLTDAKLAVITQHQETKRAFTLLMNKEK